MKLYYHNIKVYLAQNVLRKKPQNPKSIKTIYKAKPNRKSGQNTKKEANN